MLGTAPLGLFLCTIVMGMQRMKSGDPIHPSQPTQPHHDKPNTRVFLFPLSQGSGLIWSSILSLDILHVKTRVLKLVMPFLVGRDRSLYAFLCLMCGPCAYNDTVRQSQEGTLGRGLIDRRHEHLTHRQTKRRHSAGTLNLKQ